LADLINDLTLSSKIPTFLPYPDKGKVDHLTKNVIWLSPNLREERKNQPAFCINYPNP
jgi:hypothetical protein